MADAVQVVPAEEVKEKKKKKTSKKLSNAESDDTNQTNGSKSSSRKQSNAEKVEIAIPYVDVNETKSPSSPSSVRETLTEIFDVKPPKKIHFDEPYQVPVAVKPHDMNALRDIDERKLIELKEAFKIFDFNGDGLIDVHDLRSMYRSLGQEMADKQIKEMLSEALSPLDFDAFVVLLGYRTIDLDPEDVLLEALSKWDKDGNGLINEEFGDDEIKIYSHLKEPILKSQIPYDEKICQQNSIDYVVVNDMDEGSTASMDGGGGNVGDDDEPSVFYHVSKNGMMQKTSSNNGTITNSRLQQKQQAGNDSTGDKESRNNNSLNQNASSIWEKKLFLISDLNKSITTIITPTAFKNQMNRIENYLLNNNKSIGTYTSKTTNHNMKSGIIDNNNNNNNNTNRIRIIEIDRSGTEIDFDKSIITRTTNRNGMAPNQSFLDRNKFEKLNLKSIYSSDRIMTLQFDFKEFKHHDVDVGDGQDDEIFEIVGRFRYLNKDQFKIDGNLLPTTYCDYQFLPHSINFLNKHQQQDYDNLWRNFYSPRYPAKYPGHVKCSYKFIGRPTNLVEIIFEEIYLQNFNESCLHQRDKITIYNGKQPGKTFIIDVLCNELVKSQNFHKKSLRRIKSTGPYMLIEFDVYDSKRNSYGFKGRYRFIDINDTSVRPIWREQPPAITTTTTIIPGKLN